MRGLGVATQSRPECAVPLDTLQTGKWRDRMQLDATQSLQVTQRFRKYLTSLLSPCCIGGGCCLLLQYFWNAHGGDSDRAEGDS